MPRFGGDLEFFTQIQCRSRDFCLNRVEILSSPPRSDGDLVILVVFGVNEMSFCRFQRSFCRVRRRLQDLATLYTNRTDPSITRTRNRLNRLTPAVGFGSLHLPPDVGRSGSGWIQNRPNPWTAASAGHQCRGGKCSFKETSSSLPCLHHYPFSLPQNIIRHQLS